MSEISDMIQRLCPNGVEYKKLGEVCVIKRGVRVVKSELQDEGNYPVYQNSLTPLGYSSAYNYDGNKAFVISAGAAGEVGFSCNRFWAADDCLVVDGEEVIDSKYTYYFLMCQQSKIKSKVRKASIPRLSRKVIEDIEIPVPPMEVQRKIVEVLDNFSELTAELTARRKQYEYYRDNLLNFNRGGQIADVQYFKMNEIAKFTYGYTDKAKMYGNARFIRITDISDDGNLIPDGARYVNVDGEVSKYLLRKGDLLVARTGATYGKTLYVDIDAPAVYASFLIKISLNNSIVLNKYYWHFSKSKYYWMQANKLATFGGQPQFNANALSNLLIPVPPIAEQERIVAILDRFEALISDLTSGLPAEIKARQQQYEHYRDTLLSFPRKAS